MTSKNKTGIIPGLMRPLGYGVYAIFIALALGWLLGVTAEVLDLSILIPLTKMLYTNIRYFFAFVVCFHYVRWFREASGHAAWVIKPLETSFLITAVSWFAGLVVNAVNKVLGESSLAQVASLLGENLMILFVMAAGILYFVSFLERIFFKIIVKKSHILPKYYYLTN